MVRILLDIDTFLVIFFVFKKATKSDKESKGIMKYIVALFMISLVIDMTLTI